MAATEDKMAYQGLSGYTRVSRYGDRGCNTCSTLTAYWTPPPTLLRRLVCENKLVSCSLTRACWFTLTAILLTYFLVMDIFLFSRYRTVHLVDEAKPGLEGEIYSPFTHLTVKAILSDHVRHYIFTPTAEYFNTLTQFTTIFSFVTANMVSYTHLVIAFLSGKFVASENIQDRRVGVMLYCVRTWLDSFDGIVYRAHAHQHLQYNSVYSTSGYFVDAIIDTLGGFFLSFGVLFYLFKTYGPGKTQVKLQIPVWSKSSIPSSESSSPILTNGHSTLGGSREGYSYKYLFLKTLSYGVSLSVAGICWDNAVKRFTQVLQVDVADSYLSLLQNEYSHSPWTLVIFFCWRFISGQTVLNYMLVAIYMDKIWSFLRYTQWLLLLITVPLYIITLVYTQHIQQQLQL